MENKEDMQSREIWQKGCQHQIYVMWADQIDTN